MKKKLAIIISTVIIVIAIIGVSVFSYANEIAKKNSIGIDKALNIAMADAGVSEDNAVITKAKMDFEKGTFAYDIEFEANADNGVEEYEYSIKASDGTILYKDIDFDDDDDVTSKVNEQSTNNQTTSNQTTQNQTTQKQTTQNQTTNKVTTTFVELDITLEEAKAIAFNHSGVSRNDAVITSAHTDTDDGITYYEIDFKTSSYEYEYEIDLNGKVISYDKDKISSNQTTNKVTTTKTELNITLEDAKAIAFNHSGVSRNDAVITSAHKDTDDGITYYEIEFKTSSYEYEYEIALNGKVISNDRDKISSNQTTNKVTTTAPSSNAKYIGVDKAKEIALKNAGLSLNSVTFTKAKYERDDGVSQYEIEFESSTTEYEYEINAVTGKIISHSSEPIDD